MALKGIKVLEMAGLAPAPFCGMVLSDFGATVLRIDKRGGLRLPDQVGHGKQSIALDLKTPKGVEIVRKLVREHDVLIEPFRAGVMEKLGLGPDVLMKDNPGLIYARLTGYGQSGFYSQRAGHDINYLGLSGLLSLFGRANDKPLFPVNYAADFAGGGLICALGVLLALFERNTSGLGQVIDSNMVEGAAYVGSWLFRSQNLPLWGNKRGANILDTGAHYYEVYETKDGRFMTVGAIEPQFYAELLRGLELTEDEVPQWGDFEAHKKVFAGKFKEKTQQEWCEVFDGVDACVAPVLTTEEAARHRHNGDRQSFVLGEGVVVPKPAPQLSRTPGQTGAVKAMPVVGQDTLVVLKGLGYSEAEIGGLLREKVIDVHKSKF